MDITLSKVADKVIVIAYKEYLKRLKHGIKSDDAKLFNTGWEKQLFPKYNSEDLHTALYELKKKLNLRVYINCTFKLSTDCIVYMEKRNQNKLKNVLLFLGRFLPYSMFYVIVSFFYVVFIA